MTCVKRAAAVVGAVLALGLVSSACTDEPAAPKPSAVQANQNKLERVGPSLPSPQRTALQGGIAHYTYDVAVGPGEYDVIRLHRVVKERRPNQPVATRDAVFLLPGSPNYFEAIFMEPLISQAVAWDHSIAVFLAQHDVDVWGMDYAWASVPAEVTDLAFMEGWGLQRDIDHTAEGLSVARSIRVSTGQSFQKLHLLGFSYGGFIAYALAGQETELPPGQRNVKGIVALGSGMRLANESDRTFYCGAMAADQANLDGGVYSDDTGLVFEPLGALAVSAPSDPSPMIEGLTNLQAALVIGARTDLLTGQFWHFVGGYLDGNGIPSDLRYTDTRLWLDLLQAVPPHFPMRGDLDVDALLCGSVDVPFDDHLGEITLPILQVGAAGGLGAGLYQTATFTASKDVTTVDVQLQSDADRAIDFGHADLVMAREAEALVWRPILDWLLAHRSNRAYPGAHAP